MKAKLAWNGAVSRWVIDPCETQLDKGKFYEVEITEKKPERIGWDGVAERLFRKHSLLCSPHGKDSKKIPLMNRIDFGRAIAEAREIDRKEVARFISKTQPTLSPVWLREIWDRRYLSSETYPADCVKGELK